MTHPRLSILILTVSLMLCLGTVCGQQTTGNPDKVERPDAALREKAFDLLESLADQLSVLQSPENRARIGSNIAGSLWTHDEKRARAVLGLVEEDLKTVLQNTVGNDPRDEPTFLVFLKLRMDTVERVAKHDAERALAFFRATEPVSPKRLPYAVAENERALILRLAKQIERQNPDVALEIGRESLKRGYSSELLPLLRQMLKNNKSHAQILYKEAVDKILRADVSNDWSALNMSVGLARSFRPPAVDAATFRDLINFFINTAFAKGCDKKQDYAPDFCWQAGLVVSAMEQVDPVRASKLAQWSRGDRQAEIAEFTEEVNETAESGSIDDLLALRAKYPRSTNSIYWHAVLKALNSGDLERAQKLANEVSDQEWRTEMMTFIERYQTKSSISEEKVAEMQKTLQSIREDKDKVAYLLAASNNLGWNNRKAAIKLLDQASQIIDSMRTGKDQTAAKISLAMMYCLEKSDRGFAIIESLVPTLNELVTASARLDGYDHRYLRDGEWNMTAEGGVGEVLTDLAQNAGYFAWCDFDRAVALTGQFERTEIRMMAQLKLAQGILSGPPARAIVASATH